MVEISCSDLHAKKSVIFVMCCALQEESRSRSSGSHEIKQRDLQLTQ